MKNPADVTINTMRYLKDILMQTTTRLMNLHDIIRRNSTVEPRFDVTDETGYELYNHAEWRKVLFRNSLENMLGCFVTNNCCFIDAFLTSS